MNATEFAESLIKFADHTTGSIEKVIRKACIDLYRSIVRMTPVDTGRARSNWMISTTEDNRILVQNSEGTFDVDSIISAEISNFSFGVHDSKIIIYNNLEYIEALESGSSSQAPAGMVAISITEFSNYFNEAVKEFEG